MRTIDVTASLKENQSLYDYLEMKLNEFLAMYRHINPITHLEHFNQDESCFEYTSIPIYTGYGVFCNLEDIEDEGKKAQAYKTGDQCLNDFINIFTDIQERVLQNNLSFIISGDDNKGEQIHITFSDDLIHIYYIRSGQW